MATTPADSPATGERVGPGIARRCTSAAFDAAGLVWTVLLPIGGPRRWPDLALGAAIEARQTAAGLAAELRRSGARRQARMSELAERGARERARGSRRAAAAVDSAVMAAATAPIIDRVVDAHVERLLRPVVVAVLDDVLVLLENEPDRIQTLIRGQRESMADELLARIRVGAATGDTAVDRLTARMFRRDRSPVSPVDP